MMSVSVYSIKKANEKIPFSWLLLLAMIISNAHVAQKRSLKKKNTASVNFAKKGRHMNGLRRPLR